MARKGNQQKHGADHRSPNCKKEVSDPGPTPNTEGKGNPSEEKVALQEELPNCMDHLHDENKSKKKSRKSLKKEKKGTEETVKEQALPSDAKPETDKIDTPIAESSDTKDSCETTSRGTFGNSPNESQEEEKVESVDFPETVIFKYMRTFALSLSRASAEWIERHKPGFIALKSDVLKARDYIWLKLEHARPIALRWTMQFGNIMLLLFMVWLDCSLRGIDSFLRMGTTSFFSIVWCSVLSLIAMVGIGKLLIVLVVAAAVGLFLGFILALVLISISGMFFLWFYGSFWTTGLVLLLGGLAFILRHDKIALLITTLYSIYCAWSYVGWLGLLLGLNLSFISSDALLFFLRNTINEQRRTSSSQEPPFFAGEQVHSTQEPADRSPGVPSTSGSDSETTSNDEILRLLNCTDHYLAFGFSRGENVDVSILKREYRKKAMLVHPDKNMGNEKAAEAFKKLQNAYEVLLDSSKRKEYDDELRREELLNYFRKFQNASRENKGYGSDFDDPLGESRRISCRKCGFFHIWAYTKKTKSRARWCQECKDFHQAKDGEGWVEQSSQPFFFGILRKVESPSAYVCADGKIYDATEWYICQGMRCPINTHKPSFQVNTSVVSKTSQTKGPSSGQRGGVPEETMTEEEFFEWLQNAAQNGMFENFAGSTSESPSGKGGGSSGGTASKRKKKGKKQW